MRQKTGSGFIAGPRRSKAQLKEKPLLKLLRTQPTVKPGPVASTVARRTRRMGSHQGEWRHAPGDHLPLHGRRLARGEILGNLHGSAKKPRRGPCTG